ncbi:hypothetical protein [Niallia taxi]|uniref:hypothetical protein n=1 Tax=Niallia taxi TaxID=2499688 RepID=UPI003D29E55A
MEDKHQREELRELLLEEFQYDQIYNLALSHTSEEDIWTDSILSINPDTHYVAIKASEFIGRDDATIRHYLRSELSDIYIKPQKHGRYYRLNYITIFRIHLISLLMEKVGMTTNQLLVELGAEPTFESNRKSSNDALIEQISNFKEAVNYLYNSNMNYQNLLLEILAMDRSVNQLKYEITQLEREMSESNQEIKQLESAAYQDYLLDRQNHIMVASLRKKQKTSIFSLFKKDTDDEPLITEEVDKQLKDKRLDAIKDQIAQLKSDIEAYSGKRENLVKKLTEDEKKLLVLTEQQKYMLSDSNSGRMIEAAADFETVE